MTSIHTKIQEAAEKNNSLLQGLQETDSAPSQLQQQNEYIRDLEAQIGSISKRLHEVKRNTAAELKDHEKYRDSTFRRFAHKASGRKDKFVEKAAKEEREYFEAIQEQKAAEDELAYAQQLKAEAYIRSSHLQGQATRHSSLQAELDALYNSIFAGHTPEFPDEDRKEEACNNAHQNLQALNKRLEREHHILFLLGQMAQKLSEARGWLDKAYGMSQYDMFGGGTFASMQKRNYLESAESSIQKVRMVQDQLRQVAPDIPSLGELRIAMGSIWTDVVFDNIWTDMQMHDEIKRSIAQVDMAGNKCSSIVREREQLERRLQTDVEQFNQQLRLARVALQEAREDVFKRVLGGEQVGSGLGSPPSNEAPPSYAPPPYSA